MISFELSEEQQIARSSVGEFARAAIAPRARAIDEDGRIDDAVLLQIRDLGIVQAQASREDRSPVMNAVVLEELAAADATVAAAVAAMMGYVGAVADFGSTGQRDALLRLDEEDAPVGVLAVTEPGFGFDVSRIATTAQRDGDGDGFRLSGRKSAVPLAARADHFLVIADHDGALDAFVVEAGAAGVSVAAPAGMLGLRGLEAATITFDQVQVPAAMRLGEGNGADVARLIDGARVAIAAILTGLSRSVRDYVIPYTKERVVHGVPLAQKQAVAFNIADMHIETEAMRWLVWQAAWALETDAPSSRAAQIAFTYAGMQSMQIADNGLQMLGGYGFVREHPLEMWYRNARSLSVLDVLGGI